MLNRHRGVSRHPGGHEGGPVGSAGYVGAGDLAGTFGGVLAAGGLDDVSGEVAVGETLSQVLSQAARGLVAVTVVGDEDAGLLLGVELELGVPARRKVATVLDDAPAVTAEFEVAQTHLPGLGPVAEPLLPQPGRPHLFPGLLTQQLGRATQLSIHEGREVRGRDGQRSGREVAHDLEGDLLTRGGVARTQGTGHILGQGLLVGGGGHPRRLQDMLTHIGLKRLTTDPLHDVTGQRHAVVGVARGGTRRKDLRRRIVLDVGLQVRRRGEAAVFIEAR